MSAAAIEIALRARPAPRWLLSFTGKGSRKTSVLAIHRRFGISDVTFTPQRSGVSCESVSEREAGQRLETRTEASRNF